jgi:hypothetical protein
MNICRKTAIALWMLTGATLAMTAPASAYVGIEFGFGGPDFAFGDPCDYYDYYDEAPPWGLPPDYCDYPVYFEPVYFDGTWYRGPIYYRWTHGRRLFWLHGGWHENAWRGPSPPHITWQARGGATHGFRPGLRTRGMVPHPMTGGASIRRTPPGGGNNRAWPAGSNFSGGVGNPWQGGGSNPGAHFGTGGSWGGGAGHFGGASHGSMGGHGPR